MKNLFLIAVGVFLGLTSTIESRAQSLSAPEVSLLDMGVISTTINTSGDRQLANSSTVIECITNENGAKLVTHDSRGSQGLYLEANKKYVLPLNRGSSCGGQIIYAQFYTGIISGQKREKYASIRNYDVYLENKVTKEKIDISDGCEATENGISKHIVTGNSSDPNIQLVIVPKATINAPARVILYHSEQSAISKLCSTLDGQ